MISIPGLPSDNLYKFCAFGGLVLTFASLYLSAVKLDDFLRRKISVENQLKNNEVDQQWFKKKLEITKETIDHFKNDTSEGQVNAQGKIAIPITASELAREVDHEGEINAAINRKQNDTNAAIEEEILVGHELSTTIALGTGAAAIGVVLSAYGFRNWRKLQLLQDNFVLHELDPK